jgi:cobalt-zinc-cadmium efflux system membrane fusion protein
MSAAIILLVDDDEVLRQVLRRVLARDGYQVAEAGSVAQALERAREQPPSLGLIDLRLPDGDGVELAEQLQKEVGRFPLLLMTAYPLRLRDQPELAHAFKHVLTKPLNLDELRQAIESSLGVVPGPQAAAVPTPQPAVDGGQRIADGGQRTPPKRRRLRWAALAGVVLAAAGLAAALPALGMPGIQRLLNPSGARLVPHTSEPQASLAADSEEEIELPRKVVERLGVTSDPVRTAAAPRALELAGSLAFDPNRLGRVQARFAGEVVALGTIEDRDADNNTHQRPLRYGDPVSKGQILAVVLSKDLGEKKNELIDALVKLRYDDMLLKNLEDLLKMGATPPATVKIQRETVGLDRNAVTKAEKTLRTWRVSDKEIDAIKEEAKRVYEHKGQRDVEKETEWAKVEVKAPFDGTLVEKSVSVGTLVSTDFVLFQVADLTKLGVLVHAYEENLRKLQALPRGFPWKVRAGADLNHRILPSDGLQRIGLVVDPNQHTAPIMGLVHNKDGKLLVGQFVTATVELPPPPDVVSLPSSALEEDGDQSIIFVQADPSKPRYALRRVSVAMRLRDVIYARSELREEDRKKGLHAVKPGEYVVTEGVLELKAALEELQAKARK